MIECVRATCFAVNRNGFYKCRNIFFAKPISEYFDSGFLEFVCFIHNDIIGGKKHTAGHFHFGAQSLRGQVQIVVRDLKVNALGFLCHTDIPQIPAFFCIFAAFAGDLDTNPFL